MTAWRAVVMGVDRYPGLDGSAQLRGCVNDARAMAALLRDALGLDGDRLTLLTAPAGPLAPGEILATAEAIRQAFAALAATAEDHALIYFAGHGVVLRQDDAGRKVLHYGYAPSDAEESLDGLCNLILDRELGGLLAGLTRRGVSATVIADTCHSGSATRDALPEPGARLLRLAPLDAGAFAALTRRHPALGGPALRSAPGGGSFGLPQPPEADFVALSACLDQETAKEDAIERLGDDGAVEVVHHGLLTRLLLDALRQVPPARMAGLRWVDLLPDLRRTLAARLAERRAAGAALSEQTPCLEGRPERPVFGGAFRAYAPGFTVRVVGERVLLSGGVLHGLEPGARLAIHPPDTADFEASEPVAEADVLTASGATSELRVSAPVADQSRARLVAAGPTTRPIRVRWVGVPAVVQQAAEATRDAGWTFADAAEHAPADVDVRASALGGYLLTRPGVAGEPDPDAIIARIPEAGPRVGPALGAGLVHLARYLWARDRVVSDEGLRALVSVRLLGARLPPERTDADLLSDADLARFQPLEATDGVYEIDQDLALMVAFHVVGRTRLRLSLGLVALSDDGNIVPLWPAEGQRPTFLPGQLVRVGVDRFRALWLNPRPDQARSMWTLQALACTGPADADPLSLAGLAQPQTVQEVIDAALATTRGVLGRTPPPEARPALGLWSLRVAVRGASGGG